MANRSRFAFNGPKNKMKTLFTCGVRKTVARTLKRWQSIGWPATASMGLSRKSSDLGPAPVLMKPIVESIQGPQSVATGADFMPSLAFSAWPILHYLANRFADSEKYYPHAYPVF